MITFKRLAGGQQTDKGIFCADGSVCIDAGDGDLQHILWSFIAHDGFCLR